MKSFRIRPTTLVTALVEGLLSGLGVLNWASTGRMNLWWWVRGCRLRMVRAVSSLCNLGGVIVPEMYRKVFGVFVAPQEGELGALLAAEAEVADYRPSLGSS